MCGDEPNYLYTIKCLQVSNPADSARHGHEKSTALQLIRRNGKRGQHHGGHGVRGYGQQLRICISYPRFNKIMCFVARDVELTIAESLNDGG